MPNQAAPLSPLPVSFSPCWVQVGPARVKIHAAPTPFPPGAALSKEPPIRAVLPSAESATPEPNSLVPLAPLPVSFSPCWVQVEPARVNTHAAPAKLLSVEPPIK